MNAQASIVLQSFSVTSQGSDPGLVVHATPNAGALGQTLSVGDAPLEVSLFKIWTNETSVNIGEDTNAKPIEISFNFITGAGESVTVTTAGETRGVAGLFFFVPYGAGVVDWASPFEIGFGTGGILKIELLDQLFNTAFGYGNLSPGESKGANVKAIFTLEHDSTTPPPEVEPGALHGPEPAAIAVWGILGVGAAVSRWGYRRMTNG